MLSKSSAFTLLLLQVLLPWLGRCSKRLYEVEQFDPFELDKFLPSVTEMLKRDNTCQCAEWFREHLSRHRPHKELYLIYLIGSVAVSGKVNPTALTILHGLYATKESEYLLDLLNELKEANDYYTVAKFISGNIWSTRHVGFPRFLVIELMVSQWTVMKALATSILNILKSDYYQYGAYHFMLTILSMDQQPEIIANPQARGSSADKLMHIHASERTTAPPLIKALTLNAAAWQNIFRFLDATTLLKKLPLVCKSWRTGLYPMVLAYDAGLASQFRNTIHHKTFKEMFWGPSCRNRLEDEGFALRYFGWHLMNGVLNWKGAAHILRLRIVEYLQKATYNQDLLPQIGSCTLYDTFLALFVKACALCTGDQQPAFDRPAFFTDEEYERAVCDLVLKKGYILRLCPVLMADLARLFTIIEEDEVLMIQLIDLNFGCLDAPSLILAVREQAHDFPEKLANLLSPLTKQSARAVERRIFLCNERYESIVDSNILYELVKRTHSVDRFHLFITSLILYFEDDRAKIAKIVKSINGHHPTCDYQDMDLARMELGKSTLKAVNESNIYTPGDVGAILEGILGLKSSSWKRIVLL